MAGEQDLPRAPDDGSGPPPDVTVVVPTRNRAGLVERLLRQLVTLDDGLAHEVVVVDEASSDATPALLDRYRREHGVRVLRHDEPRGVAGARNAGLAVARAPYVSWIDDDDLTAPDRLRRQHDALRETGARWSCTGRVDIDDDLAVIGHMRCPPGEGLLPALLRSNCLPTAAQGLLVEVELAREVGGYDEAFQGVEDWEMCIRLAEQSPPHLLDEPLVGYRAGAVSLSSDTALMEDAVRALAAKHRDLARRLGVELAWADIHGSLLDADLMASPAQGRRRAWRAFRAGPSPVTARRVALVALAPRWYAERAARRRAAQVPDAWRAQARAWLDGVGPVTT